ncbi:hypothetical protein F0562_005732 [Nyssa sinensis]|uniref:Uncharacterized protein n=1 Tax=Nyssa sinensis TaxID=561372 RepID=A0A5J5AK49_9ASTE|nr:hypothetical protein F0562_005732 [Nyssa sinensis]
MDSWSEIQLKKMEADGNEQLNRTIELPDQWPNAQPDDCRFDQIGSQRIHHQIVPKENQRFPSCQRESGALKGEGVTGRERSETEEKMNVLQAHLSLDFSFSHPIETSNSQQIQPLSLHGSDHLSRLEVNTVALVSISASSDPSPWTRGRRSSSRKWRLMATNSSTAPLSCQINGRMPNQTIAVSIRLVLNGFTIRSFRRKTRDFLVVRFAT